MVRGGGARHHPGGSVLALEEELHDLRRDLAGPLVQLGLRQVRDRMGHEKEPVSGHTPLLGHGPAVEHFAPLLRNWSRDVVVLTHGHELPDPIRESLAKVGIPVYESPVESLEGSGRELEHIRLADGTTLDRRGLFVKSTQRPPDLIANLGVALDEHGYVTVDRMGSTSLPGVWATVSLSNRRRCM